MMFQHQYSAENPKQNALVKINRKEPENRFENIFSFNSVYYLLKTR